MAGWLRALMRSFRCAFAGLAFALRRERNLQVHAMVTLVVAALGFYVELSRWEWCAIALAAGLVWAAECFNTAIEVLCDRVTKEQDQRIRQVKDTAAAAVLTAAMAASAVGVVIFWRKLF